MRFETYLKGINIMSDNDQLSFLLFNQLGDSVGTSTEESGLLLGLDILTLSLGFSNLLQALLLSDGRFGTVFFQQFEHFDSGGLVQSLAELMDWWWDLQTFLQNSLLALDANVFGPSYEARQIAFGLDVLT